MKMQLKYPMQILRNQCKNTYHPIEKKYKLINNLRNVRIKPKNMQRDHCK